MESLAKYHEAAKKGRLNGPIVREHRQWAKNDLKSPTGKSPNRLQCNTWAVSSAVRASGLHPEGPAFKSLTAHHLQNLKTHCGGICGGGKAALKSYARLQSLCFGIPMTLVITEVSEKFGCVVVGDTAVTIDGSSPKVVLGAEKVHYSPEANLGFAIWGNACLAGQRVDRIVSSFVSQLTKTASPRSAGQDLAELLASEGKKDGRAWKELRGGVHICGYQGPLPVLFHVHTGHNPPEPQGPFQLHEDYRDASVGVHLRNGKFQVFAALFDGMKQYAAGLQTLGFKWPHETVDDRVSYNSIMLNTVAETLKAAGYLPTVGNQVSAFAFNRKGIQVDKRLPRSDAVFCVGTDNMASFREGITQFPDVETTFFRSASWYFLRFSIAWRRSSSLAMS